MESIVLIYLEIYSEESLFSMVDKLLRWHLDKRILVKPIVLVYLCSVTITTYPKLSPYT